MSDMKLTNERIKAFDTKKISLVNTPSVVSEFGKKQNSVNEVLALNINDLIKRVCALEDQQVKNKETMSRIAGDLSAFKKELDRVRLSEKLNTGAIERLDRALRTAREQSDENPNV